MDEDLMSDFLVESGELLETLDADMVQLEQNPEPDVINRVFRGIHTIKGTSGFFELTRLQKIAHIAENVLDQMRNEALEVKGEYLTPVFASIDTIREILEALEEDRKEPEGDDSKLLGELEKVLENAKNKDGSEPITAKNAPKPESNEKSKEEGKEEAETKSEEKPNAKPKPKKSANKASATEQSLRVNVTILERIMNTVSELVLTRNQLLQLVKNANQTEFASPVQQLARVTSSLQELVMRTRMQPIGSAWSKVPRLVRDLQYTTGKKIQVVMNGEETELDRTVHQAIQDPITHMIRNSADHGIEDPETRKENGKSEAGTIKMNAYHEGGFVVIEISDDGKGIPVDVIRNKTIEKGLLSKEEAEALPNNKVLEYIFHAGFSTAQKVTSVSGRGVGMDVVKSNIQKIGGTVQLDSEEGKGTVFKIKIPLTLAIVSAFLFVSGGEYYAIAQTSVLELVRINDENRKNIETVNGA